MRVHMCQHGPWVPSCQLSEQVLLTHCWLTQHASTVRLNNQHTSEGTCVNDTLFYCGYVCQHSDTCTQKQHFTWVFHGKTVPAHSWESGIPFPSTQNRSFGDHRSQRFKSRDVPVPLSESSVCASVVCRRPASVFL